MARFCCEGNSRSCQLNHWPLNGPAWSSSTIGVPRYWDILHFTVLVCVLVYHSPKYLFLLRAYITRSMCEVRIVYRDLSNLLDVSSCDPPLSLSPLSSFLVLVPRLEISIICNGQHHSRQHKTQESHQVSNYLNISGEKYTRKTEQRYKIFYIGSI